MLKDEIIYKLCNETQWVLSHMKFLRKGDVIKTKDNEIYKTASNPYIDRKKQWTIDIYDTREKNEPGPETA